MHVLVICMLEKVAVPLEAFTVPFVTLGDPPQVLVLIVSAMLDELVVRFPNWS